MRHGVSWPPNRITALSIASSVLVTLVLLAPVTAEAGYLNLPSLPPPLAGGSENPSPIGQAHLLPLTHDQSLRLKGGTTPSPGSSGGQTMFIHVGGAPWGETYDPAIARLFVASTANGNVSVIDTLTNRVVSNVSIPYGSYKPVFDGSDGLVYVTSQAFQIYAINATSDQVVGSSSIGPAPEGEAYAPISGEVYIAGLAENNVTVFSGVNAAVPFANITEIRVGQNPYGLGFDAATGDVYVANEGDGSVSIIDCRTNQVVGLIPHVQPGPAVVADSANGNVFVGGNDVYGHANVTMISGVTNKVVAVALTGNGSGGAAYDPVTGDIYVTQRYNFSNDVSGVTVLDGITDRIVGHLPTQLGPIAVTYAGFNHELYTSDADTGNVSLLLPLYSISFHETGLPEGTPWTVTLNNQSLGSNASNVSFTGADGPYEYAVRPIGNYTATPSAANITLVGANVTFQISFSNGTLKSHPSTTYLGLTTAEWWLTLAVLVVVVGVAIPVLFRRKRRTVPPAGPPPNGSVTGHAR